MGHTEMGGHGHDFGHESVSEPVSEADSDSDTRFSQTSDTDSDTDMGKLRNLVRIHIWTGSDSDMGSDMNFGLGHRKFLTLEQGFGHGLRTWT